MVCRTGDGADAGLRRAARDPAAVRGPRARRARPAAGRAGARHHRLHRRRPREHGQPGCAQVNNHTILTPPFPTFTLNSHHYLCFPSIILYLPVIFPLLSLNHPRCLSLYFYFPHYLPLSISDIYIQQHTGI